MPAEVHTVTLEKRTLRIGYDLQRVVVLLRGFYSCVYLLYFVLGIELIAYHLTVFHAFGKLRIFVCRAVRKPFHYPVFAVFGLVGQFYAFAVKSYFVRDLVRSNLAHDVKELDFDRGFHFLCQLCAKNNACQRSLSVFVKERNFAVNIKIECTAFAHARLFGILQAF